MSVERLICNYFDRLTVYPLTRWGIFCVLFLIFLARMYLTQGFFIFAYALGILLLHLLIGFLSPQIDPENDGYVLPVRETEEYRPFQRRVPEYRFWCRATAAAFLCIVITFFPVFDIPVYWPILAIYFVILFFLSMKQQIKHMIKHRYIPFSWGKQTYGDITRRSQDKKKAPTVFGKKKGLSFPSLHTKSTALTS